jgi:hypothetical protein
MWLDYFTLILQSQKAAEDTLAPDTPFPELAAVKQMLYFLATTGESRLGIAGRTGWSLHTTPAAFFLWFSLLFFTQPLIDDSAAQTVCDHTTDTPTMDTVIRRELGYFRLFAFQLCSRPSPNGV